jgi:hypothetical protein
MRRPSPALILSCIGVFLAFTGGAVAAGQIGSKQVKDGSITGKDIKNDSLTAKDITGQLEGPRGSDGQPRPAGTGRSGRIGRRERLLSVRRGDHHRGRTHDRGRALPCRAGGRRRRLQRDSAGDRAFLGA